MLKSLRIATCVAAVFALGTTMTASASAVFPLLEVSVCPSAAAKDAVNCESYQMTTSRDDKSESHVATTVYGLDVSKPAEGYGFSFSAYMLDPKADVVTVNYSGQQKETLTAGANEARFSREGKFRMRVDDQVELDLRSAKVSIKRIQ